MRAAGALLRHLERSALGEEGEGARIATLGVLAIPAGLEMDPETFTFAHLFRYKNGLAWHGTISGLWMSLWRSSTPLLTKRAAAELEKVSATCYLGLVLSKWSETTTEL